MAIVVVQVGQCGNQLGDELFSQLSVIVNDGDHGSRIASPFFTKDGKARCVLVDTEPKVVQGVQERHQAFIRPDNVIYGHSGRGNNWGLGYYGNEPLQETNYNSNTNVNNSARNIQNRNNKNNNNNISSSKLWGHTHNDFSSITDSNTSAFHNLGKDQRAMDASVLQRALRAIHLETRRTDDAPWFEAIVLIHSLAGGTGSGLASHLAEKLRFYFVEPRSEERGIDEIEEYNAQCKDGIDGLVVEKRRARFLISIAVAPQMVGEVATQGFNVALTLNVLMQTVDAILLLRNDDVLQAEYSKVSSTESSNAINTVNNNNNNSKVYNETESTRNRFYNRNDNNNNSSSLIHRCITFKEANEVFVALLLPLFNYGLPLNTQAPKRTRIQNYSNIDSNNNNNSDSEKCYKLKRCNYHNYNTYREEEQEEEEEEEELELLQQGVIGKLVTHCVPLGHTHNNIILSLLPTPQRSYVRFRNVVYRGNFYILHGNKEHMPGYSPAIPTELLLLSSLTHEEHELQYSRQANKITAYNANRQVQERPPWRSTLNSSGDDNGSSNNINNNNRRSEEDEDSKEYLTMEHISVPHTLLQYYNSDELRQSPVSKLYTQLEGVCVVNQVKELNNALLFPLLRSAALKVKLGAFIGPYLRTGVTSERITSAYQKVAKVLCDAEMLEYEYEEYEEEIKGKKTQLIVKQMSV